MKLYQRVGSRVKFLEIYADGPRLISEFGFLGGRVQHSEKICQVTNPGQKNERSPEAQAIFEVAAKITKKKKEGYSESLGDDGVEVTETMIDIALLEDFPTGFCPNKPISKAPEVIRSANTTFGQRKYNGHCIFLVKTALGEERIFSRRMENLTAVVSEIPIIKIAMRAIPVGSFILHELVYFNSVGKEIPTKVSGITRAKNKDRAMTEYNNTLASGGKFEVKPFDALCLNKKFIGNIPYLSRMEQAKKLGIQFPEIDYDWKSKLEKVEALDWEGYVLRQNNETSYIGYTFDGKAHRAGSWKEKFNTTDEFFVEAVLKGISGKHADFYAKFKVAQYDTSGNKIDRGYINCGTLTHDELRKLTEDIDSGELKLPFVVEVKFAELTEKGAIVHGVIQRLRPDKTPEECVFDE